MRPTFLDPDDLASPTGYSHVAVVPAGSLVWISGQVAFDADGNVVGVGSWEHQTRAVFENLTRALVAGGASWSDVVKLTYFLVDIGGLATVRKVRDEFIDAAENPPASSLVQVVGLVHRDLLLEVEAVAWRPG